MSSENDENTQWPNAPAGKSIEGLDSRDKSWGDYSIDNLLIRKEIRTIHDVIRNSAQYRLDMYTGFDADFHWPWPEAKQSKLIESVIMRIPLPAFYFFEDKEGKIVVIDGVRRMAIFHRFLNDDLTLQLPDRKELDGKKFKDLESRFQNRIEGCNLLIYAIDSKVSEHACLDIMERVNSGEPMSRQQVRHCMHAGKATKFLKEEARTDIFLSVTGESLDRKTMRDCEFVNRFCAFQLLTTDGYEKDHKHEGGEGHMDDFLSACLREMNDKKDEDLLCLSAEFRRGLANNQAVFGERAFRRPGPDPEQKPPNVLNAPLWDVMSTGLSKYDKETIEEHAESLDADFSSLIKEDRFQRLIIYGTSNVERVKERFRLAKEKFDEIIPSQKNI